MISNLSGHLFRTSTTAAPRGVRAFVVLAPKQRCRLRRSNKSAQRSAAAAADPPDAEFDPDLSRGAPRDSATFDALSPVASAYHKHTYDGKGAEPFFENDDSPYMDDAMEVRPLGLLQSSKRPKRGWLERLAAIERGDFESDGARPRGRTRWFREDKPIRVRVLDIDALSLEELHKAFMHTLVRRRPAEVCVHVASRVAQFRDTYKHQSYENMLRDCGRLFGPTHGPELLALFSRCHATISVPFMVDYTRRFGQFSRAFIAAQVERSLRPAFFDFLRYEEQGGVRPLPLIVSRPWALSSYTRLLAKSTIKSELHEQLRIHGQAGANAKDLQSHAAQNLPVETRVAEQLGAAGALQVTAPARRREPPPSGWYGVDRPALLEEIMEAEHSGKGWNQAAEKERRGSSADGAEAADHDSPEVIIEDVDESAERGGRFRLQFEHVVSDEAFSLPGDALLDPDAEPLDGDAETLEPVLPERFWSPRKLFFRHEYRSYRIMNGQWTQVADPRGPRHKAKRRHRLRPEVREQELRRQMRAEAQEDRQPVATRGQGRRGGRRHAAEEHWPPE